MHDVPAPRRFILGVTTHDGVHAKSSKRRNQLTHHTAAQGLFKIEQIDKRSAIKEDITSSRVQQFNAWSVRFADGKSPGPLQQSKRTPLA